MGLTTAEAQVAKRCYKNQTAGWIGVTKLDHLGAQVGAPVAPYGTVWLSDDEAILTSRAPAAAKDNPFVEQEFPFTDGQKVVQQMMAPLVLVEDADGEEGAERFVPSTSSVNLDPVAGGQRDAETVLQRDSSRPVATAPAGEVTLEPSANAAVPPSHAGPTNHAPHEPAPVEEDLREESWTAVPEDRTEAPQQGALAGSNEKVGPSDEDAARDGTAQGPPPQQPAPTSIASTQVQGKGETQPSESAGVQEGAGAPSEQGAAEETAAHTPSGEETGAAEIPAGEAPEGEFASHEEVGSPDAPSQTGEGA